jgi:hypothetical protein
MAVVFALGVIAIAWVGAGFLGSDRLALAVTIIIACVYGIGFYELLGYRAATATLSDALTGLPEEAGASQEALGQWLTKLDPGLYNAVRARIEGERVGLPAPVMTPYLVGLLVMLGLLGTFAGMVDTLRGAVFALEGTTELQAIRAGLAAPINGLSLAFGTSVAGVAASAMLGLASTLSRRDRMSATGALDTAIATVFRTFSLTHNRRETYLALQQQAQALPEVARRLENMAGKLEQMGDKLQEQLLENQSQFHAAARSSYSDLALSVDKSLKDSLGESGRQATDALKPLVVDIVQGVSSEVRDTHSQLATATGEQVAALSAHFENTTQQMLKAFDERSSAWLALQEGSDQQRLEHWSQALGKIEADATARSAEASREFTGELKRVTELQQSFFGTATRDFESLSRALSSQWDGSAQSLHSLTSTISGELSTLREEEARRGEAAVTRLAELETTVATHLAALGKELEEPMTRLITTASETPRAAASVIEHLRGEISKNIERDNDLLLERQRTMEQLNTLSRSLEKTIDTQRKSTEKLVGSSAEKLSEVSSQFTTQVESELSKVSVVSETFAGSVTQMSNLADAFGLAIGLFNESNKTLMEHLLRIEQSMEHSSSRSDEQMGYYVAQAREIIDQSMMSQKEIFDGLRQLGLKGTITVDKAS